MTDSVTPPDPPLVDPETGETAPLSPRRVLLEHAARFRQLVERGIRPAPIIMPPEVTEPPDAA